jgi:undecaprenyl diphosphate synthase
MEKYFLEEKTRCAEKGIRIKIIGERTRFNARTMSILSDMEAATAHCKNLLVQIALSYGGRDEIVRAAQKIAEKAAAGELHPTYITEKTFTTFLDTHETPDIDLVIRTGGAENRRLSNFLPWQTVYSELFFSDLLWPEFSQEEFDNAIDYYHATKRKLGK